MINNKLNIKKIISLILIAVSVIAFACVSIFVPKENEYDIIIGTLGELELPNADSEKMLIKSLYKFREENVDVIVLTGSITKNGTEQQYEYFFKKLRSVYGKNIPKLICAKTFKDNDLVTFQKYFGNPNSVSNINGYDFVTMCKTEDETTGYKSYAKATEILQKCFDEQTDADKPIFVITNQAPKNTYDGTFEQSEELFNAFKNNENVFSISLGGGVPVASLKNIYIREFTALGCCNFAKNMSVYQSVEVDKIDPVVNVIYVKGDVSDIVSYNCADNKKLDYSLQEANVTFVNKDCKMVNENGKKYLVFTSAKSNNLLYYYKLKFEYNTALYPTQTIKFSTDYINGKEKMNPITKIDISNYYNSQLKCVTILAYDQTNFCGYDENVFDIFWNSNNDF